MRAILRGWIVPADMLVQRAQVVVWISVAGLSCLVALETQDELTRKCGPSTVSTRFLPATTSAP